MECYTGSTGALINTKEEQLKQQCNHQFALIVLNVNPGIYIRECTKCLHREYIPVGDDDTHPVRIKRSQTVVNNVNVSTAFRPN